MAIVDTNNEAGRWVGGEFQLQNGTNDPTLLFLVPKDNKGNFKRYRLKDWKDQVEYQINEKTIFDFFDDVRHEKFEPH